jgi:hypothetical protein
LTRPPAVRFVAFASDFPSIFAPVWCQPFAVINGQHAAHVRTAPLVTVNPLTRAAAARAGFGRRAFVHLKLRAFETAPMKSVAKRHVLTGQEGVLIVPSVMDAAVREQMEGTVLDYLASHGASFVQDVLLARSVGLPPDEGEVLLARLERDGRVLVRPHVAGDPHLEGADLRIVALVQRDAEDDSLASAVRAIATAWDVWLAEYLANHRCT